MKFDEILIHIGEFGLYQKRLYILVCIPAIFTAIQTLEPVYIMEIPKHRCAVSDNDTYEIQNENHEKVVNDSIPYVTENGKTTLSSCLVYDNSSAGNTTVKCNSWVYDHSTYTENAVMKYDIVCDKLILHSHTNMAMFAGSLAGAFITGYVSDFIGRKITFFINVALLVITSIVTAFCPDIYFFIVTRMLNALAATGLFATAFVIGLEMVGPSKRMIAGMGIEFFWCVGLFLLLLAAYFIRHWVTLQLVVSIPSVVLFGFWWLIPESPRWLMSRGRMAEVEAIIRHAAKVNGVKLSPEILQQLTHEEPVKEKSYELFTSRVVRNRTFVIFFNWFVVNMIYYGLGLNVDNLSGDIFLNTFFANIAETAAYVICMIFLDRIGRKFLHCGSMLLGGIACVAVLFPVIYNGPNWSVMVLSTIGKLGASSAFAVIYIFSGELFPTVVRHTGIGLSGTAGKLGGMVSPYIADLGVLIGGDLKVALPQIVFGAFAVVAGLVALYLPETLNRKLPDSIEDAKTFGKADEKTFSSSRTSEKISDCELNGIQLKSLRHTE